MMSFTPWCATLSEIMGKTASELAQEPRPVVLAVDDDPGLLESLELVFEGRYEVLTALNGLAALEIVRSRPIDAVLLDVLMPGLDGFEVLKRLKAVDPGLPVIVLTAIKYVEPGIHGMQLGAYHYLTKPFDERRLLTTVAGAIQTRPRYRGHALLIGNDAGALASLALMLSPHASVVTAAPTLVPLTDLAWGTPLLVVHDSEAPPQLAVDFVRSLRERFARSPFLVLTRDLDRATALCEKAGITPDQLVEKPYRLDDVLDRMARVAPSLGQLSAFASRLGPQTMKLLDYLAKTYRQPLNASDLASAAGLSTDRLAHLVRERLGVALMEYVTRFRVEVARHLIAVTDSTIEEIADRTGFVNASHLSRAFLHQTGYRPGEYRRLIRGIRNECYA
jgi:DNA-binding response OmpR family regulator